MAALCEDNSKDGMGTATGLIHVGGSHSPGGKGVVTRSYLSSS